MNQNFPLRKGRHRELILRRIKRIIIDSAWTNPLKIDLQIIVGMYLYAIFGLIKESTDKLPCLKVPHPFKRRLPRQILETPFSYSVVRNKGGYTAQLLHCCRSTLG